jgi:superfamily I DNA/RNA helicase
LREEWDRQMRDRGIVDFADVTLRARDHARRRTTATYRAVIIDEAQDLTLVGLQMLRALANGPGPDRSDGLFIVGDGAQRIYAGGFTLRQAGVDVPRQDHRPANELPQHAADHRRGHGGRRWRVDQRPGR